MAEGAPSAAARHPHAAVLGAACLLLALTAGVLDALAARSPGAGVVWIVSRGAPGPALNALLAPGDARLLGVWAGGRLVQLHVDSLQAADARSAAAWITLRLPAARRVWPGCS